MFVFLLVVLREQFSPYWIYTAWWSRFLANAPLLLLEEFMSAHSRLTLMVCLITAALPGKGPVWTLCN